MAIRRLQAAESSHAVQSPLVESASAVRRIRPVESDSTGRPERLPAGQDAQRCRRARSADCPRCEFPARGKSPAWPDLSEPGWRSCLSTGRRRSELRVRCRSPRTLQLGGWKPPLRRASGCLKRLTAELTGRTSRMEMVQPVQSLESPLRSRVTGPTCDTPAWIESPCTTLIQVSHSLFQPERQPHKSLSGILRMKPSLCILQCRRPLSRRLPPRFQP